MKYSKLVQLSLAIAAIVLSIACTPSKNANTGVANTNMATPEPTPDKAAIVAEITRIEKDWPRIIKEHDGAAVRRLEADDIVLVYPDGTTGGKEGDVKDIESGNLSYDSWDVSELNVKVLDSDAAVASMLMTVKGGKYKTPDGNAQDISGHFRGIDTFVRRNGQWQVVASSVVKLSPAAEQALTSPANAVSPTPTMKPSPKPTRRPPLPPPTNQ
jgi:ketosteroid isomerase-like protein